MVQTELVHQRRLGQIPDQLMLVEHEPVITLGKAVSEQHLHASAEQLAEAEIELWRSGRGGDITFHGPGQLVAYPILELDPERRDLHRYLRDLEQVLIDTCADYGVTARRIEGKTGIWVGEDKLASIGIRVSRWITSHGVALNYDEQALPGFEWITPCGLEGVRMVSLGQILGIKIVREELESRFVQHFCRVFERRPKEPL